MYEHKTEMYVDQQIVLSSSADDGIYWVLSNQIGHLSEVSFESPFTYFKLNLEHPHKFGFWVSSISSAMHRLGFVLVERTYEGGAKHCIWVEPQKGYQP